MDTIFNIFCSLFVIGVIVLFGYLIYTLIIITPPLWGSGKSILENRATKKYLQELEEEEIKQKEKKVREREAKKLSDEREKKVNEREKKKKTLEKESKDAIELKKQEELNRFNLNEIISQMIYEIELCTDHKPCPRCNEIEVGIISISPNARSIKVVCKHCSFQYLIKMEPDKPDLIIKLHDSYITALISSINQGMLESSEPIPLPLWRMDIKKFLNHSQHEPLPTSVKKAVWKRDNGQCVNCGSDWELQYDHIIPVSKGGSSTVQNIQILCKKCNLQKFDKIQ